MSRNIMFLLMYHRHKLLDPIYICITFPCLAYFPIMKTETISQTTRRHIPEDSYLHSYRCENLKSNKIGMPFFIFPPRLLHAHS
jgi:hypothetical protein